MCSFKIIQSNSNFNKLHWIDEVVSGLTDLYKLRGPYDLCKRLNISIKRLTPDSPILNNTSSVYYRNYKGDEVIFIKDDLFGYDEEDILRHQLAHAILHTDISNTLIAHSTEIDNEANYFVQVLKSINIDIVRRS